jgi:DNA recombination protein RmuC
MFVPTEGIYAELMREPGFADDLRNLKVLIASPSTMQALLVSYQIGFSTLAISKRSSEIERLLGAVKTDFDRFRGLLLNVDRRLEQARNEIGRATNQTDTIRRHLRDVTDPTAEQNALLPDDEPDDGTEILDVSDLLTDGEDGLAD